MAVAADTLGRQLTWGSVCLTSMRAKVQIPITHVRNWMKWLAPIIPVPRGRRPRQADSPGIGWPTSLTYWRSTGRPCLKQKIDGP